MKGCNDFISTDVTEMDMQKSQSPCFVPLVADVTKDSDNPNKKARLEKLLKKVAFNLPGEADQKIVVERLSLVGDLLDVA